MTVIASRHSDWKTNSLRGEVRVGNERRKTRLSIETSLESLGFQEVGINWLQSENMSEKWTYLLTC